MPMIRQLSPWIALLLAVAALPARAQTIEIKPPFKLEWGMTLERIERMLKGAKLKIVDRKEKEDGTKTWTVEGFPATGPRRVIFGFRRDELVEVELQYQRDDWDEPKYDAFMGDLRRTLEKTYGPGQLIARKTERAEDADVTQTVVGYKWNHNNSSIELFFFQAEAGDAAHVFRTLSVHYKTL